MAVYIYQLPNWPRFTWQQEQIAALLAEVRHRQGRLLGKMESLGLTFRQKPAFIHCGDYAIQLNRNKNLGDPKRIQQENLHEKSRRDCRKNE